MGTYLSLGLLKLTTTQGEAVGLFVVQCDQCGAVVADNSTSAHSRFHEHPTVKPWPLQEPDRGRRGD